MLEKKRGLFGTAFLHLNYNLEKKKTQQFPLPTPPKAMWLVKKEANNQAIWYQYYFGGGWMERIRGLKFEHKTNHE